ncbi:MAG: hypothetical protein KatS3mg053_2337 [Candidatus Roseilinea sp.]|nr:MAG: hypothetical protein KatS3mg053_2181 [Candidatus Roseilinea sp.]BCX04399.1 MAG: hypothetical protein KatS3mg053_2337 [Candidatus Roseilinea sp.]
MRHVSGTWPTDWRFIPPFSTLTRDVAAGQRLESGVGLYDYPLRGPPLRSGNARYYSPLFGRFLSPDSSVPRPDDPSHGDSLRSQALDRYAYVRNNPLRYTDPSGHAEKDPFKRFLCDWAPQLCQPSTPPLLNEQQAGQALSAQPTPVMLNNGTQMPLFAAKREGEGEGKGSGIGGLIGSLLRLLGSGGAGKAAQELSKDGDPTNEIRNFKSFTAQNFRENLMRLTGKAADEVRGLDAHHVLPRKFERDFAKAGLNIHDPKFGSWVNSSLHRSWSGEHNEKWRRFLSTKPGREDILQFAQQRAKEYGFDVHFDTP